MKITTALRGELSTLLEGNQTQALEVLISLIEDSDSIEDAISSALEALGDTPFSIRGLEANAAMGNALAALLKLRPDIAAVLSASVATEESPTIH